jgi:protein gp37
MADKSKIEWTTSTWNPVTGCHKVSAGCAHCYAERFSERFRSVPNHPFSQGFDLKLWPERLSLPLSWKEPRMIFVNSMSDLFHGEVSDVYVQKVFKTMREASWHTFQVLTKRSDRLVKMSKKLTWAPNIWMGVSVENEKFQYRIDDLRKVNSSVKFLSLEPLIGPIPDIQLNGIDWVIVGGESGPGARLMEKEWVEQIHKQCRKNKVPFFFKQWGGFFKKRNGRELNGRTWDQMPKRPKVLVG